MTFRNLVATGLNVTRILDVLGRFNRPTLLVLNYHRLFESPLQTRFDEGVFSHSLDTFTRQMAWLQSHVDILSEADLLQIISGGRRITRQSVMITFDDGYRDNYDLAWPVMRERGIPATFFIPFNQIEGTSPPWWDQIAFMVKESRRETVTIDDEELRFSGDSGSRKLAIEQLLKRMKRTPIDQVEGFLGRISQALEVSLPERETLAAQFMTWDQIREVSRNGIAIGSHSMNHHVLTQLPADQQRWELSESKGRLEDKLGRAVNSLAYPVGGRHSFNEQIKSLAQECGYKFALSYTRGFYKNTITDPFEVHRVKSEQTPKLFKAQVFLPELFCSSN